jgi:hypothetical protein
MEKDPALRAVYFEGLQKSAHLAAESLPLGTQFDPNDGKTFSLDWRAAMMPLWKPHSTEQEAVELANQQVRAFGKLSPRRHPESALIREPASAAWIVTLCPDSAIVERYAPEIERVIAHIDASKLYYVTFFWVESAWWRLR